MHSEDGPGIVFFEDSAFPGAIGRVWVARINKVFVGWIGLMSLVYAIEV